MWSWLNRLLGRSSGAPAAPTRLPAARAGRPAATRADAELALGGSAPADHPAAYGLRQALLGRSGRIEAVRWSLPPSVTARLQARGDEVARAVQHLALLRAAALGGRAPLLDLSAGLLERPAIADAVPAGAWVLVPDLASLPAPAARALRGRGVRLGRPDGPPARDPPLDWVLLDAAASGLDGALLSAQRWRECWPRIGVVVLGLSHVETVESALQGGAHLAGGRLDRTAVAPPRREVGSAAHRICELMNHLALDRDTATIAAAVRADVAMAYRLLRYASSAAIGAARTVETVDDALALLGRAELQRWLSMQLLAAGVARPAAAALQAAALARGRFVERLALGAGHAAPAAGFTMGMLSLIEPLFQVPLAQALAPLKLGPEVSGALLQRAGPWAAYLELVEAAEAGESARTEAAAHALAIGPEDWARAQSDAWQWADAVLAPTSSVT